MADTDIRIYIKKDEKNHLVMTDGKSEIPQWNVEVGEWLSIESDKNIECCLWIYSGKTGHKPEDNFPVDGTLVGGMLRIDVGGSAGNGGKVRKQIRAATKEKWPNHRLGLGLSVRGADGPEQKGGGTGSAGTMNVSTG